MTLFSPLSPVVTTVSPVAGRATIGRENVPSGNSDTVFPSTVFRLLSIKTVTILCTPAPCGARTVPPQVTYVFPEQETSGAPISKKSAKSYLFQKTVVV